MAPAVRKLDSAMKLWVDADACPRAIKEVIYRAADRMKIQTTLVANQFLRVPKSPYIKVIQVPSGFDIADAHIVAAISLNDLVITADIPLASEVVSLGAVALNPRGTLYTAENIQSHLARRDFMEELRSTGTLTGGPPTLAKIDVQSFANQLDRYLTKQTG